MKQIVDPFAFILCAADKRHRSPSRAEVIVKVAAVGLMVSARGAKSMALAIQPRALIGGSIGKDKRCGSIRSNEWSLVEGMIDILFDLCLEDVDPRFLVFGRGHKDGEAAVRSDDLKVIGTTDL